MISIGVNAAELGETIESKPGPDVLKLYQPEVTMLIIHLTVWQMVA